MAEIEFEHPVTGEMKVLVVPDDATPEENLGQVNAVAQQLREGASQQPAPQQPAPQQPAHQQQAPGMSFIEEMGGAAQAIFEGMLGPPVRDVNNKLLIPLAPEGIQKTFREAGVIPGRGYAVRRDPADGKQKVFETPVTEEQPLIGMEGSDITDFQLTGIIPERAGNVGRATGAAGISRSVGQGVSKALTVTAREAAAREAAGTAARLTKGKTALGRREGGVVPATAGLVSSNKMIRGLEKMFRRTELSNERLLRADDLFASNAGRSLDEMAAAVGVARPDKELGESLQTAAKAYKTRFDDTATKLFEGQVHTSSGQALGLAKVPKTATSSIPNTRETVTKFMDEISAGTEDLGGLVTPEIMHLLNGALQNGQGLTMSQMQILRSNIGKISKTVGVLSKGDTPQGQAKQIFKALSKDMEEHAGRYGASAAFSRANRFYKAGLEQMDQVLDRLFAAGGEKAFDFVTDLAGKGASRNIRMLERLKGSLRSGPAKDAVWGDVAASALKNFGQGVDRTSGRPVFNVTKAMDQYDELSEAGKRVIFGPKSSKLRIALDGFRDVLGRQEALVQAGGSTGSGFFNVLFSGLGAAGGSRLMTSPAFVTFLRALQKTPSGKTGTPITRVKIVENLSRLNNMLGRDPVLRREDIENLEGITDKMFSEFGAPRGMEFLEQGNTQ